MALVGSLTAFAKGEDFKSCLEPTVAFLLLINLMLSHLESSLFISLLPCRLGRSVVGLHLGFTLVKFGKLRDTPFWRRGSILQCQSG